VQQERATMKKEDLKKVIQKLTVLADGKSLHRKSTYTPTISAASITAVNLAIESVAEGNIDVNILECVEESYRQYTYADDKLFNGMHIKNICNGAEWSIVGWNYTGVVLGQLPCTVTHIVSYKKLMEDYTKPDGGLLGVAICPRKKEKV
jgi:hypothetical protein